jgi:CHAT domain
LPLHLPVLLLLAAVPPASGDGGALTSLTGAFLAAGSRGVVATLWDVAGMGGVADGQAPYYKGVKSGSRRTLRSNVNVVVAPDARPAAPRRKSERSPRRSR